MPRHRVAAIVARFVSDQARYCSNASGYTETEARVEFIDPFFACLDWDMSNHLGLPNSMKDVVREESQPTETSAKRPDYTFRVAAIRKYFVEAKKPSVDIKTSRESAFQVRSYGWTAGLTVSILTNFRTLRVYDTRTAPNPTDGPDVGLLMEISCDDYETRIDELRNIFGRESVALGSLEDRFGAATAGLPIGKVFLDRFNSWRLRIAKDLKSRHTALTCEELNDLAQKIINRVVFVRMCEDRGIEGEGRLRQVANRRNVIELRQFFREMDDRYNTGLFNVVGDPLQRRYAVSSAVFLEIVEELYFPQAPYSFSVLDADFLGQVYEHFLTKQLNIDATGAITLVDKPAYDGREIITTPQPLVDEIVRRTFAGKLSVGTATIEDLLALEVLDVAVGSSRFLLRSFDELVDAAIAHFRQTGNTTNIYRRSENDYRLSFVTKRELLRSCLYGIDIDYNAVEVARFSLLVKLLEDESLGTLPAGRKILPNLDRNIIWGNSVVGDDFQEGSTTEDAKPLDWTDAGLPVGFDAVVGNPPYVKTEEMKQKTPAEFAYYKRNYQTPYKQFDKYFVFVEKAVSVLNDDSWIGIVIPNKWITNEAGKKIRALLAEHNLVAEIVDFGNELIFEGRSTYVCLLVLSNIPKDAFRYMRVDCYKDWLVEPGERGMNLGYELIRNYGSKAWILPSTPVEGAVLSAMFANSVLLGEIADVVNGIQTSAEKVFPVWDWTTVGDLVEFERDERVWRVEKAITRPYLMDSSRVHSYAPLVADALVIFPYEFGEHGEAILIPPDRMEDEFPSAWKYLSFYRNRLERRDVSPEPAPGEFYRYGRHQAFASAFRPNKIIYSVNQLGDKYSIDTTGVGFASGGTAGEVAISNPRGGYSLEFILALLNQKVSEFFLRKRGSPFRGGYYSRGSAVVKDFPVPLIDFDDPAQIRIHNNITTLARQRINSQENLFNAVGRQRERIARRIAAIDRDITSEFDVFWRVGENVDNLILPGE